MSVRESTIVESMQHHVIIKMSSVACNETIQMQREAHLALDVKMGDVMKLFSAPPGQRENGKDETGCDIKLSRVLALDVQIMCDETFQRAA